MGNEEAKTTLEERYQAAEREDYFGLLGITDETPEPEIRKSYLKIVKLVHPDNLRRNGLTEEKDKAGKVFKKVTEAYEIMTNPERRAAYIRSRQAEEQEDGEGSVRRVAGEPDEEAKIALHQGRLLLRQRAWKDAETLLTRYVTYRPEDAVGFVLLGWAIFQNNSLPDIKRVKSAAKNWKKAVQLDPENADAHYHYSLYFKVANEPVFQRKHLKKAVELDGAHVSAQREMRLLEMRQAKAEESSGQPESMGDFFKRFVTKLKNVEFGKKKKD
jgi:curved DNA-binding protein CbpA